MDVAEANRTANSVIDELETAVIAEREVLETVFLGFLSRGHVLLEDVPGTGKTLTARSLASALSLSFSRVQFTPDLLPADVTGTYIYNENAGEFEFAPGPIFANIVLADEINRAPPKTQSALLEAMEEGQITVEGETHTLPEPFFVIATQNPVEMEGTFELPEAQVDRFLVQTTLGYPDEDGEIELLRRRRARTTSSPTVEQALDQETISALLTVPETVAVDDDILTYQANIARATRNHPDAHVGVSPRGTQRFFEAARTRAAMAGREFVTPDDVKRIAHPVLAHRIVLTAEARVENRSKSGVIADALASVSVPTV